MSNVKLQASASGTGTVTIAPPVTNSDLTINLPANSGTVPTIASVVNNGVVYTNSTGAITSSSALTFDGTNLGVGTTSPVTKFQVSAGRTTLSANNENFALQLNNGSSTNGPFLGSSGLDTLVVSASSGAERMRLDSSGNLGIGVTPSAWISSGKAIDIGGFGSVAQTSSGSLASTFNAYQNSAANWIYKTTNAAAQYQCGLAGLGQHAWFVAPSGTAGNAISFTQAMTLDSSGRLLVGTTSNFGGAGQFAIDQSGGSVPAIHLIGTQGVGGGGRETGATFSVITNDTGPAYSNVAKISAAKENATQGNTAGYMAFSTRPNGGSLTERARITSGGDLLVGTTSGQVSATVVAYRSSAAVACVGPWNAATSGDNLFVVFNTEATATQRGSIDYNRAGGLTRYNTTSDYRAKDIIGPVQNSGATIDALKVYEGVMKGATQSRPMLIAHEAQEHAPYAVSGVKDEVNEDGTPKFQQMDVSSLVPLLLAEIQSLRARVAALESNP